MKNFIRISLFVLALITVQFAKAQTVDDIVAKYINALGGKEKLLSLNSVKLTGNLNVQGNDVSITVTKLHNVGVRSDFDIMGTNNYQIVTPTKGTMYMPIQGMASPTDMSDDQFKASQSQLDVQSALLNYKEKGTTVELVGTEKAGSDENYKLKLTFKNGIVSNYFIGSKDYHLNKITATRKINGENTEVETGYNNYKQNADGFWFAYSSTTMQGEVNYDKIETNLKVDPTIFVAQ